MGRREIAKGRKGDEGREKGKGRERERKREITRGREWERRGLRGLGEGGREWKR